MPRRLAALEAAVASLAPLAGQVLVLQERIARHELRQHLIEGPGEELLHSRHGDASMRRDGRTLIIGNERFDFPAGLRAQIVAVLYHQRERAIGFPLTTEEIRERVGSDATPFRIDKVFCPSPRRDRRACAHPAWRRVIHGSDDRYWLAPPPPPNPTLRPQCARENRKATRNHRPED